MLATLAIRNFALIDQLELDFGEGLSGLTGETGAGKSIVIDALSLLLGGRAASEVIRTGADAALVEGLFHFDPASQPELVAALEAAGIEDAKDLTELVVFREISRSGRNRCRINGRLVPVLALANVGENLVDVHGQHEHQSLLKVEKHRDLLDAYAGAGLLEERTKVQALYREFRSMRAKLREVVGNREETARRVDSLRYQLAEIASARLANGEEEELARERLLLVNAERLLEAAGQARAFLRGSAEDGASRDGYGASRDGSEFGATSRGARKSFIDPGSGAVALLGEAALLLEELSRIDEKMAATADLLRSAEIQADEAARAVGDYLESLQYDPGRLEEVESRLNLIKQLERKYGPTVQSVMDYAAGAQEELARLESPEESLERLQQKLSELERGLADASARLSERRANHARLLEEKVQGHLADLNMRAAVFRVQISSAPDPDGLEVGGRHVRVGPWGTDQVEFLLSANPGEPPRPLTRVASGGELSRVMLALKSALSEVDRVPTLIFDEIDAGIGGRTAQAVAEKLCEISGHRQVILVTHLPQIACLADRHFVIEKREDAGRTHTGVHSVQGEERVAELARMLGGVEVTPTTLRHAREMVALAEKSKSRRGGRSDKSEDETARAYASSRRGTIR